jgi:hypothetical protein
VGNNIVVDAEVDKPNINNAAVLQVEDAVFDEKKLCDILLGTGEVKKEKFGQNTSYSIGNKTLDIYKPGAFNFSTPLSEYINEIINTLPKGNAYKFKAQDLFFMTREKAIKEASKTLKELNITTYGLPTVYALDNNTIKQE